MHIDIQKRRRGCRCMHESWRTVNQRVNDFCDASCEEIFFKASLLWKKMEWKIKHKNSRLLKCTFFLSIRSKICARNFIQLFASLFENNLASAHTQSGAHVRSDRRINYSTKVKVLRVYVQQIISETATKCCCCFFCFFLLYNNYKKCSN